MVVVKSKERNRAVARLGNYSERTSYRSGAFLGAMHRQTGP